MDRLNLDDILDSNPRRAAAMIVGLYRVKVGDGRAAKLPSAEVGAVEMALASAAHQAHERYGDAFVEEMGALHPELCGRWFHQPVGYH